MVIKIANVVTLAAVALAALVSLLAVPQASANYRREPEDLFLLLTYLLVLIPLGSMCFANARNAPIGTTIRSWQLVANLVTVFLLLALLVIGRSDPALFPIVVVCLVGPSAWLVGFALRS